MPEASEASESPAESRFLYWSLFSQFPEPQPWILRKKRPAAPETDPEPNPKTATAPESLIPAPRTATEPPPAAREGDEPAP